MSGAVAGVVRAVLPRRDVPRAARVAQRVPAHAQVRVSLRQDGHARANALGADPPRDAAEPAERRLGERDCAVPRQPQSGGAAAVAGRGLPDRAALGRGLQRVAVRAEVHQDHVGEAVGHRLAAGGRHAGHALSAGEVLHPPRAVPGGLGHAARAAAGGVPHRAVRGAGEDDGGGVVPGVRGGEHHGAGGRVDLRAVLAGGVFAAVLGGQSGVLHDLVQSGDGKLQDHQVLGLLPVPAEGRRDAPAREARYVPANAV